MANHNRRSPDYEPELRKNVVTREWVIIAKGRSKRPSDLVCAEAEAACAPAQEETCPFCEGREATTPPEVYAVREKGAPNGPGWRVRVIPNKFAALRLEGSDRSYHDGIFSARAGHGAHEVIIETPQHGKDLWELDDAQVAEVIEAYRNRYLAYETGEQLPYVLVFRNHGPQAGTLLAHAHSQLIALPVEPHQIQIETAGAAAYWEYLGRCVFCALIKNELASGERAVIETPHFLVTTAFAARYPYETWILPKRHSIRFADLTAEEAADLAKVLKATLGKLAVALGRPSYNFAIHSAPLAQHNVGAYHWHLEVYPRFTTLGGFELGSAIYINTSDPEDAAEVLREATPPLAGGERVES